jgi:intein/homing endonuclease
MIPNIKRVGNVVWEIPLGYRKDMRVPVRIYATEKLLKEMDEMVYHQALNVSTLPGILKYSYVMPDGHSGYGFPIGGVAAMDAETGVISPGGIGFDINCLHPDTKILDKYGYFRKIKDFENKLNGTLVTFNLKKKKKEYSKPILLLKKYADKILVIKTKGGYEIKVSGDHPILTPQGMVEAKYLKQGDSIAVFPFEGVEYVEPSDEIILDVDDIKKVCNSKKVILELKKRGLLPLRMNSWQIPILAKLVGYITGGGCIFFTKRYGKLENWVTVILGNREDLEEIKQDIITLGFKPWKISSSKTKSIILDPIGKLRKIQGVTTRLDIPSKSFAILLHALGVPKGRKTEAKFRLPKWIWKSPKWIKRLYLAGLFGAELTKPTQDRREQFRFKEPRLSINKREDLLKNGYDFLRDIAILLEEFNVKVNKFYVDERLLASAFCLSIAIATKIFPAILALAIIREVLYEKYPSLKVIAYVLATASFVFLLYAPFIYLNPQFLYEQYKYLSTWYIEGSWLIIFYENPWKHNAQILTVLFALLFTFLIIIHTTFKNYKTKEERLIETSFLLISSLIFSNYIHTPQMQLMILPLLMLQRIDKFMLLFIFDFLNSLVILTWFNFREWGMLLFKYYPPDELGGPLNRLAVPTICAIFRDFILLYFILYVIQRRSS